MPPVSEYPEDFDTSYDRKFLVADVTTCTIISVEDLDGGEDCAVEDIVKCSLSSDDSGIEFTNTASEDCLVTVKVE